MSSAMKTRTRLLSTTVLAGVGLMLAAPAFGQAADTMETITVTGYRASLLSSTVAKRDAVGFSDAVFAEDIGKFPDSNIAEALNRIPGVTISRETDGEGVNVSIRGLGTNFTRMTMNGTAVAVASTGATDSTNNNREVDLNMFPGELFTSLSVIKSPQAMNLEGGAAGNIDMRTQRPFDKPGFHVSYNLQGTNQTTTNSAFGKRGTLIVSDTEGAFGLLIGVSGTQNPIMVTGWEDGNAGWVGPSEQTNQCPQTVTGCTSPNTTTPGTFGTHSWPLPANVAPTVPGGTIPSVLVPIPSGYALTGGAAPYTTGGVNYFPTNYTMAQADYLALNPGLTAPQLANALLPRLGRSMFQQGTRDHFNAVISGEFRPTDSLHFYLDFVFGRTFNNINRSDMNWGVRGGAGQQPMYPANLTLASDWLTGTGGAGGAVTSGTFYGGGFALEARPYKEKGDFYSFNPGMSWEASDMLHFDAQLNASRSHFLRDSPTVFVLTCANASPGAAVPNCAAPAGGNVIQFKNQPGMAFPTETSAVDLNNPNNFVWYNGRVNLQDEKRYTYTNGAHINASYGGDQFKVSVGGAYDEVYRDIVAIDASTQWQNAVCGGNPNVFLPNNGNLPGCYGAVGPVGGTPLVAGGGIPAYPGYGTGASAGFPALTFQGSLIPTSALPGYMMPGPTGFATVNFPKFLAASNYYALDNWAIKNTCNNVKCNGVYPFTTSSNTGGNSGAFDEKDWGWYAQIDGKVALGGRNLIYDIGLRWSETHQDIISPTQTTDVRNYGPDGKTGTINGVNYSTDDLQDGGKYPNYYVYLGQKHVYQAFLPSVSIKYQVADDFQVKASISRTMNRPNPASMIAVVNFSDLNAQSVSIGNPQLKPYFSNNIEIGAEYYTGGEGYIGVDMFRKSISGFTVGTNVSQPFSYLAQYNINWASLSGTQQTNLCGRTPSCVVTTATDATVANTTVSVGTQINAQGLEIINGIEIDYVQPLDFLTEQYLGIKGFGFNGNMTIIDQKSTGAAPTFATGVAPFSYNVTSYYEDNGIMLRMSYVWNDRTYATGSNQQSLCLPAGSNTAPNTTCSQGAYLFGEPYGQADFSSSLKLSRLIGDVVSDPELTFNIQNVFNSKQRSYDQYVSSIHSYYIKGQTYMFGVRGTF